MKAGATKPSKLVHKGTFKYLGKGVRVGIFEKKGVCVCVWGGPCTYVIVQFYTFVSEQITGWFKNNSSETKREVIAFNIPKYHFFLCNWGTFGIDKFYGHVRVCVCVCEHILNQYVCKST